MTRLASTADGAPAGWLGRRGADASDPAAEGAGRGGMLRRGLAVLAAAAAAVSLLAGVPVGGADAGAAASGVERVDGRDRFETAVRAAWRFADNGGSLAAVVLVSGRSYADALSAAGVAGQERATVLFAERDALPEPTRRLLRAAGTQRAVIVGGPAAVGAGVEAELAELGIAIERVWGADRYETSAAAARRVASGGIGLWLNRRTALVVPGTGWADAIAVGPAAWAGPHPVVLADPRRPDGGEVVGLLKELRVSHAVVVASAGVWPGEAVQALEDALFAVTRVSRSTPADTSGSFARRLLGTHPRFDGEIAATASGAHFADGLAASALLGLLGSPLVLDVAPPSRGHVGDMDYFAPWLAQQRQVEHVFVIGGHAAVPGRTAGRAKTLLAQPREDDFFPDRDPDFVLVQPATEPPEPPAEPRSPGVTPGVTPTTAPGTTAATTTTTTTAPPLLYVTPVQVAGDAPAVTTTAFHDGSGLQPHDYWRQADFPKAAGLDVTAIRRACSRGKDCIVSIDNPVFERVSTYDLYDDAIVLVMTVGTETRAYPVGVIASREVVNDTFGDVPVAVTY